MTEHSPLFHVRFIGGGDQPDVAWVGENYFPRGQLVEVSAEVAAAVRAHKGQEKFKVIPVKAKLMTAEEAHGTPTPKRTRKRKAS